MGQAKGGGTAALYTGKTPEGVMHKGCRTKGGRGRQRKKQKAR